jgi:hypothetical protein
MPKRIAKHFWILLTALALAVPAVLCAQQADPHQSSPAAASGDNTAQPNREAQAGTSASTGVAPSGVEGQEHPAIGAPSMEIGVEHVRSFDSDETTDEYLDQPRQAQESATTTESAKAKKHRDSEESRKAYREAMEVQYPGWYY